MLAAYKILLSRNSARDASSVDGQEACALVLEIKSLLSNQTVCPESWTLLSIVRSRAQSVCVTSGGPSTGMAAGLYLFFSFFQPVTQRGKKEVISIHGHMRIKLSTSAPDCGLLSEQGPPGRAPWTLGGRQDNRGPRGVASAGWRLCPVGSMAVIQRGAGGVLGGGGV